MDLDNTNFIEKDEVRRCLTVVLKEDPRIRLDDDMLADIIEKVPSVSIACLTVHPQQHRSEAIQRSCKVIAGFWCV